MSYHPANMIYVRCDRCGDQLERDDDEVCGLYFTTVDEARDYLAGGHDGWALIGHRGICWKCHYIDARGTPAEHKPISGGQAILAEKDADALPPGGPT